LKGLGQHQLIGVVADAAEVELALDQIDHQEIGEQGDQKSRPAQQAAGGSGGDAVVGADDRIEKSRRQG
jgi:hypothetical protein